MTKRAMFVLLLTAVLALPSAGGPYDQILCPMVGGRFFLIEGQLWLEVLKEHGRAVEKRRERIANPLDDRSHEVLSKRESVSVEVHQDKKGGLFVHWGTLKDDK